MGDFELGDGIAQRRGYFELIDNELLPTANTDNDPFNQFHEYAFGGNPSANDDPAIYGSVHLITTGTDNRYFEISSGRRSDHVARNLLYVVEFSDLLSPGSWDSASGTIVSTVPIDADFERVTVRFNQPIGGANTRWFARLFISEGPPNP